MVPVEPWPRMPCRRVCGRRCARHRSDAARGSCSTVQDLAALVDAIERLRATRWDEDILRSPPLHTRQNASRNASRSGVANTPKTNRMAATALTRAS